MKTWIYPIFERAFLALMALAFLQVPLFMHTYEAHLRGHVSELTWQVDSVTKIATTSGKTTEQYIQKFCLHPDEDIQKQGEMLSTLQKRWQRLSLALHCLENAGVWTKPWIFLFYVKWEIVKETFFAFKPGVPLTVEAGFYALFGLFAGFVCFRLLQRIRAHAAI